MDIRVAERSEPPEDIQSRYISAGFANLEVSNKTPGDWYCLLHKVQGAAALPYILDGTLAHMIDNTEFEEDRLFCEWVYYVDWEGRSVSVHGHGDDWSEKSFKELDEDWMLSLEACENVGDISSDEG